MTCLEHIFHAVTGTGRPVLLRVITLRERSSVPLRALQPFENSTLMRHREPKTMNNTTNAPGRLSPAGLFCRAVTYRELHEDAAGMGLDDSFFAVSQIDPNAAVKCNCEWDEGHHENCDIVAANRILMRRWSADEHWVTFHPAAQEMTKPE